MAQLIEADWQHLYEKVVSACSDLRFDGYEHRCKVRLAVQDGILLAGK